MKILSKLFAVAIVVALAAGFSSCKKDCFDCTLTGSDSVEICEEDAGGKAAITAWELTGGTCTKK